MTTEVFHTTTGSQFAVFIDYADAMNAVMLMDGFATRPGPDLIGLPLGLASTRYPECDDGQVFENLGQYRVCDDQPALLVKHLYSGVVFYKLVDDFR